jgi:hypothetical protein
MKMKYEMYAGILLVVGIIIAIWLSLNKSKESKYMIWGITTILIFAPVLSWLIGRFYGLNEGSGFAMMAVFVVMFPILLIVGVFLSWIGIKKR